MYLTDEQLESKWWHRLAKVIIILIAISSLVFAVNVFMEEFEGSYQFLLSFRKGYDEIKVKEQELVNYRVFVPVIEKIVVENPPVFSKNSFSIGSISIGETERENRKLYPREFIETQCKGDPSPGLPAIPEYDQECFEKIIGNYPNWKIKSWTPRYYSVLLVFLIVPVIYFGLWFIYKKIILYIVFGKKTKKDETKT